MIAWRKPRIEGVTSRPVTPLQAMTKKQHLRFTNLIVVTMFSLIPAPWVVMWLDGHWWNGQISLSMLLISLSGIVLFYGTILLLMRKCFIDGKHRADAINARLPLPLYDESFRGDLGKLELKELLPALISSALLSLAFWWSLISIIRGEFTDSESSAHFGRYRTLFTLIEPYFPKGPIVPFIISLFLTACFMLFFISLFAVLKRLLRDRKK
jgi:hypothetical protein